MADPGCHGKEVFADSIENECVESEVRNKNRKKQILKTKVGLLNVFFSITLKCCCSKHQVKHALSGKE